ncbi:hypothetical protein NDU88_007363 [Pleurodeles waltl]|uniref:Uncharacterized protein n=1 Tax=Pleurodeles waltl TaxID=8319 RepID=A0AAV7VQJ6_PLEWA|nr:hypothetical protein NDU88_007363 [Pleurodeles waltl]
MVAQLKDVYKAKEVAYKGRAKTAAFWEALRAWAEAHPEGEVDKRGEVECGENTEHSQTGPDDDLERGRTTFSPIWGDPPEPAAVYPQGAYAQKS